MIKYQGLLSLLLAVLLLAGCGTAAPASSPEPAGAARTVVVKNVAELLGALAPDTTIEIDAEELDLDSAPDYGFAYSSGAYTWTSIGDGQYELTIRNIDGLTIRSKHEGGTSLTTGAAYANVIALRDCRNLTLEGLTLGHSVEPGGCCGDVLYCSGCEDILVRRCDLFGCGVTAVNAWMCTRLTLEGCTLRDCSASAVNATLCTNVQVRDCSILRCGRGIYSIATICVASCNGFALINSTVRDCDGSCLLDETNSSSVCLLGCEATGSRFSEALFRILDGGVTVSDSALSDNDFGKCYSNDNCYAVNESGKALTSFADFVRMERKPFTGEYIGPAPYVTPGDAFYAPEGDGGYVSPGDVASPPPPAPRWEGARTEVHAKTVDELLAAIEPHTTVYLDGEEFALSTASNYGGEGGAYYDWIETYDGPQLLLHDLDDFSLVGGGIGVTLVSAAPRYADVLHCENCRDISFADMTLGHRIEPGSCVGDVLEFASCTGVTIERCGLFGCGVVGINASTCADLLVSETNIYDCSYLAANLYNVEDALFTDCSVTNCGTDGYGFNGFSLSGCSGVFYDRDLLADGDYIIGAVG
ncbi:MAG: right-handed parallel beta-helix repeat-containing protein [Oscillospiraceae bacterium]|nr:right-handed parallel beta-helix repeat-containing protein [Oscillospiraceae bacterium]